MLDEVMVNDVEKLCLGVITGAHGLRGAVKVKSFTESPAQLTSYGVLFDATGKETFNLSIIGQAKGQLIAGIAEVKDRNRAEALKGTELFIARDKLPEAEEDEFYHADLVGLKARVAAGQEYGVVKALFDFGAGDILEIRGHDGSSVMLPFTREMVPSIDIEAGYLLVVLPFELDEGDQNAADLQDGTPVFSVPEAEEVENA